MTRLHFGMENISCSTSSSKCTPCKWICPSPSQDPRPPRKVWRYKKEPAIKENRKTINNKGEISANFHKFLKHRKWIRAGKPEKEVQETPSSKGGGRVSVQSAPQRAQGSESADSTLGESEKGEINRISPNCTHTPAQIPIPPTYPHPHVQAADYS